jgi:membrane protease YdiL (CAAX protease family)
VPVLVLSALQNSLLEEIVVVGYLLKRLEQLGTRGWVAIAVSAVLRGAYHLYQGFGGFLGNMAMGVVFGLAYRRWGRLAPLVVAHTLLDVVAFVGYALIGDKVSWLPGGG